MSACALLTCSNATRAAWAQHPGRRHAPSVAIKGDSGKVEKDGFEFAWAFESQGQRLSIKRVKHSNLIACPTINARIDEEIKARPNQHSIVQAALL